LRPTAGKIFLDGKDIWENPKDISSVRFRVGVSFQYPEYQLFEETVFKDISFGPINMGLSEQQITQRVFDAAKFVGLDPDLMEKSPFELSGGEKRRVSIAGIIAMDPEVLVLDEPTGGLDPVGRDLLLSQIVSYHKTKKNTVILVSHSMEEIARVADRVLVLNHGEVVMLEKTAVVFSHGKELTQIGLKLPQITNIISELKNRGHRLPGNILTLDQAVEELSNYFETRRDSN
jgi:energy-coupling factor transport system ATP-binding protein